MSMFFDSPIDFCPVARKYVLLDQTQAACAREAACAAVTCPLAKWFNRSPVRNRLTRRSAGARATHADSPKPFGMSYKWR